MSDFDKEAEREKLREKYERDKEERQATQRMSDLLLKGATMTNAHCGTCGDPLFQMDGTTFCPSCHGNPDAVEGTDLEAQPAEDGEAGAGATADDGVDAAAETADQADPDIPTDSTAVTEAESGSGSGSGDAGQAGSEIDVEPTTDPTSATGQRNEERGTPSRADANASSDSTVDRQPRSTAAQPTAGSDSSDSGSVRSARRAPASSPPSVDGDLETARDALVRTLEKFAEEAAATDDPRYAKECLEAAREAGETLSTLR
ncbi:Sjogren's syndrome/scleroderma autoantigen 1 family protein [Natrinema salifodinae]|uniref:Sjogren's syndrome/scleroderma autoantigen 1 (Autoantigen p27) n=1 Tax=Natrinema salifodinae TaxID=1202768 RepID=A0A1I0QER6_9EURY|nr:Sjogren's syndrome/scleroderma autoantigen 1 family protein [Natrinema salifodinae]SEW25600.1 Sjogren's syndrome/scleroderma autoantigen 1 (Autoantigen p27) [Natrinema salifodinae]